MNLTECVCVFCVCLSFFLSLGLSLSLPLSPSLALSLFLSLSLFLFLCLSVPLCVQDAAMKATAEAKDARSKYHTSEDDLVRHDDVTYVLMMM